LCCCNRVGRQANCGKNHKRNPGVTCPSSSCVLQSRQGLPRV
jgi:hypothetical protein